MSQSSSGIEFADVEECIDRFVEVWQTGGYEKDSDSAVGWETWKWDFQQHLEDEFLNSHEISALEPQDVESLIKVLDERVSIDAQIPVYMIGGGASGGIAWNDFKEISLRNPESTAETLSFFFDSGKDIEKRLEAFQEYYLDIDESVSPGSRLALAGCLLMFVYPDQYVHYKWTQMREFFAEYSGYKVKQGFDATEYRKLNEACKQLRTRLEGRIESPSMLHVQTMIWSASDLRSMNEIPTDDSQQGVSDGVEYEDHYFWVNTSNTNWQQDGGEVFYRVTNSSGGKRRNQDAYQKATPGDKVLVYQLSPTRQIVGQAHVTHGVHEASTDEGSIKGITLQWDESLDGVSWSDVESDPELETSKIVESNNSFVITELTEREYKRILSLGSRTEFADYADELAVPATEITVKQAGLHFPDEEWNRIQSRIKQALANGDHVLLFGPPGTGKTKLARQVCEATVGERNYELVTASADWSTFDTVGGYQTTSENTLEFEPGIVLDRFQDETSGAPANEWLIIDELNRADIDKAFGSLFSALTGESVTLPFDGSNGDPIQILDASRSHEAVTRNRFYIPDDWQMLATMNTLDKTSLYEMSYAFMRRWAFIPVGIPDLPERTDGDDSRLEGLVEDYVRVWAANNDVPEAEQHYEPVGRIWRAVNAERAIGPAIVEDIYEYVVTAPSREEADYVSPIIMYVFPQLEGLRRTELERLIDQLDGIVNDEASELWTVAQDFFQVDLQPSGEN